MEHIVIETAAIENAVSEAADAQIRELNDLQLAFVGGGTGEVTLI